MNDLDEKLQKVVDNVIKDAKLSAIDKYRNVVIVAGSEIHYRLKEAFNDIKNIIILESDSVDPKFVYVSQQSPCPMRGTEYKEFLDSYFHDNIAELAEAWKEYDNSMFEITGEVETPNYSEAYTETELRRRIKYSKNPMERKRLEQELGKLTIKYKRNKFTKKKKKK